MPLSAPAQPRVPAPGGPVPINVTPQAGDKPGQINIDMKDLKLPPNPAASPAGQKSAPPATKK
jgi:hypothetical protein